MKYKQFFARLILFLVVPLSVAWGLAINSDLTQKVIEVFALIATAFLGVFIYVNCLPTVSLRIIPTWINKADGILKIRTEVENTSRVLCVKKRMRFQILEQEMTDVTINEWVAFDENYLAKMLPQPVSFKPAEDINTSTAHLYPKEIISAERIYKVNPSLVQHVGLQFQTEFGFFTKHFMKYIKYPDEQWGDASKVLI